MYLYRGVLLNMMYVNLNAFYYPLDRQLQNLSQKGVKVKTVYVIVLYIIIFL